MKERINRKDNLPKWFDIESYDVLLSLSDDELLFQLIERREHYRDSDGINDHDFIDYYFSKGVIKDQEKYSYSFTDREFEKRYSDLQLHAKGAIAPLNIIKLGHLYEKSLPYIESNKINRSLRGQKRSVTGTVDTSNEMHLSINLDWPDELIIKDLMQLLPMWREGLSNTGGSHLFTSQSWEIIKRKIFDYNIFPILDLLTWAKWSGKKITKGVLSVVLFPDGRYDYTNITQTIMPFIENLMKDFSIEKYRREIMDKN